MVCPPLCLTGTSPAKAELSSPGAEPSSKNTEGKVVPGYMDGATSWANWERNRGVSIFWNSLSVLTLLNFTFITLENLEGIHFFNYGNWDI